MRTLPREYNTIIEPFVKLFSERIWKHAKVLLIGAILAPAERTVTAILRVMGLSAVGKSKSLFMKFVPIWVLRRKDNGLTYPSCA